MSDSSPPLEILTLPVGIITTSSLRQFSSLNPHINVEKVSQTQINISTARSIDFSGIWKIDYDILSELNPNLRLELILGCLFISPPMGSINGNVNIEIGGQIRNWNTMPGGDTFGNVGDSSTEFILPWGNYLKPDVSWMSHPRFNAVPLATRHMRFPGVPHYVNETVSLHDTLAEQRRKCGLWVWSGVEVVTLVDLFHGHTYLYASTASGFLPAPGAFPGVIVHPNYPTITERDYVWPALPPPMATGNQFGPALAIIFPAGCTMVMTGGPFSLNHATIKLN